MSSGFDSSKSLLPSWPELSPPGNHFPRKGGPRFPSPPIPAAHSYAALAFVPSSEPGSLHLHCSLLRGEDWCFARSVYLSSARNIALAQYRPKIPNESQRGSCLASDGVFRVMCTEFPLFLTAQIGRNDNLSFPPKVSNFLRNTFRDSDS